MERQPGTWERGFPKLVMYYVSLSCTLDTKSQSHIKRRPELGARDNLSHSLPLHAPRSLTNSHLHSCCLLRRKLTYSDGITETHWQLVGSIRKLFVGRGMTFAPSCLYICLLSKQ